MDNIMLFNPNTNEISSKQTPIEIALGVDENGMTTARKLYEFLELNPSNYSKWCKTNITENQFAIENEDYTRFVLEYESAVGIKEREDYRLTAHFAKKLSCKGNSAKAELAREYFTRFEEKAKEDVIDRQQLSPLMQSLMSMVEVQAKQELEQKRQAEQLNRIEQKQAKIEQKQDVIVETFQSSNDIEDFQVWAKNCLSRIAESGNYRIDLSRNERHRAVTTESYVRLVKKTNCRLELLVANAKARALQNNPGIKKSELDKINKLYVISHDKKLKIAYELVIKEMMVCYCVSME